MDEKKFTAMLPMITAALVDKICTVYHLNEDSAIEKLYSTEFYKYLEQEETKLWQYSIEKMFDLYQSEVETGRLELPDY